jgi:hypothetical protein
MSKPAQNKAKVSVATGSFMRRLAESIKNNVSLRDPKIGQLLGEPTPANQFKLTPSKTAVLGIVEQVVGIYQTPSFRDEVTTFWNDPLLKEAITMFGEQVVATGAFLTGNSKYELKINGMTALDTIKHWYDVNDIDGKLLEIAIELKAFGNSLWRITDDGFVKIPIESVWHAVRIKEDIPLQVKYNMQLTPYYGSKVLEWGTFIHFRIGITGYRAPFGQGVLFSILARPIDSEGNVAPSIYDIRLSMRASLHEGFKKFSFGNELWCLKGMSNEDFNAPLADGKTIADHISDMSSTGNRIVTNTEGDIKLAVPQRTESYDKFIKQMNDEFLMSLADPSLKLGLEQGFTKATSVTASEVYKYKIATMRKAIKEHLEDLFKQILDDRGFNGIEAGITLNFGPEEVAVYDIADIFAASDKLIISKAEARVLLAKYHKWDINGKVQLDELDKAMMKTGQMGKPPMSGQPARTPTESLMKKQEESGDSAFGIMKAAMAREGLKGETAGLPKTSMRKREESGGDINPDNPVTPQHPRVIITPLSDALARYSGDMSKVYIDPLVPDYTHRIMVPRELFVWQLVFKLGFSLKAAEQLGDTYEMSTCVSLGIDYAKYQADCKAALALILARTEKVVNPVDTVTYMEGTKHVD